MEEKYIFEVGNNNEISGINTIVQLSNVEKILMKSTLLYFLKNKSLNKYF